VPNQLPAGYEEREDGGVHVVARADALQYVLNAVREDGSLYAHALQHASSQLAGGRAPVAVLARGAEEWAVKHYWRGGAVSWLVRDRYVRWGPPRPLKELRVQSILRARGVDTPQLVAAVVYEQGMWYRGDVATLVVPGALDLGALTLGPERWPQAERERAWFAAGKLLHRFFMTGAVHADLNMRNVIVQRETVTAYLLDLDRCQIGERMKGGAVAGMLARFHRSRRKLERVHGVSVSATELAALKRGRGV
jgi:3-deoxy-D-manno-octulosonic acid kinase